MNKHIQDLYNQALETRHVYGGANAKPGEMYSNYVTALNTEKFAELIIQECANLTLDHKSDDYYQGWLDYRDLILKHFNNERK
jgi:hypothetical protein